MVYEATILLIRYATTTQPKLDRRGLASDKFKSFSEVACLGSGCGSVGRAVTCNIRGPRFNSSHWQNL